MFVVLAVVVGLESPLIRTVDAGLSSVLVDSVLIGVEDEMVDLEVSASSDVGAILRFPFCGQADE